MFQPDRILSPNNNGEHRCSSKLAVRPCYVPLQLVSGALGGRPTLPILGNVLLDVSSNGLLSLTGTDLEVEMIGQVYLQQRQPGWPHHCAGAQAAGHLSRSAGGRRSASAPRESASSSVPAAPLQPVDPAGDRIPEHRGLGIRAEFDISQLELKNSSTRPSSPWRARTCATLNGMLFEKKDTACVPWRRTVTGWPPAAARWWGNRCPIIRSSCHAKGRWSWCACWKRGRQAGKAASGPQQPARRPDGFIFTSKLVDGRFDWRRVIPGSDKALIAGREDLRQAFARAAIPSNEKFPWVLQSAGKPAASPPTTRNREEAEELFDVQYAAGEMEIGLQRLLRADVLNTLKCTKSGSA